MTSIFPKKIVSMVLALAGGVASAATFTLTQAPTTLAEWKSSAFYKDGNAPTGAATDEIWLDYSVEVTITSEQEDVIDFLNGIYSLKLQGAEAQGKTTKVTFDIAENKTVELMCRLEDNNVRWSYSKAVKTGKGALKLMNQGGKTGDADTWSLSTAYYAAWDVLDGELWLPPPNLNTRYDFYMDLGMVYVGPRGTIRADSYPSALTGHTARWCVRGLYNDGRVVNEGASSILCICENRLSAPAHAKCDGFFSANLTLISVAGDFTLNGTENAFGGAIEMSTVQDRGGVSSITVRKFGNKADTASSVGTSTRLAQMTGDKYDKKVVYGGEGETTDKDLMFINGSATKVLASEICGGVHGGLVLTGTFDYWSSTKFNPHIVFSGDHTTPCVFSGTLKDFNASTGFAGYVRYLKKTGKGEWYFPENPNLKTGATIEIADGTLAYDTIAPKGVDCSLGTSTLCYGWDAAVPSEEARVPYAFLLGSDDPAATGILESRSPSLQRCSDRPFALKGRGGFRANSAPVEFAGVSGVGAGARTLVLDGTNAAESVVNAVSDGEAGCVVSIEKNGSGAWALSGSQTFTGPIDVNAGTLTIRRPTAFRYYRLLIKEVMDNNPTLLEARGVSTESANANPSFDEIGLWAADGSRQNMNLTYNPNGGGSNLRPGQFGFGNGLLYDNKKTERYLPLLFDGCRYTSADSTWGKVWGSGVLNYAKFYKDGVALKSPRLNDESTWIAVDMCLREGAQPIDHFDVSNPNDDKAHGTAARGAPTACQLLGSVDGETWEEISETCQVSHTKDIRYAWVSNGDGTSGVNGMLDNGLPFYPNPEQDTRFNRTAGWKTTKTVPTLSYDTLPDLGQVSVAEDGKLAYAGDAEHAPSISELKLDANGGGTIDGFAFAASGTLDVVNYTRDTDVLPATFTNVTGLENLENWTLRIDGTPKPRYAISVSGGKVRIFRPGMAFVFR